MMGRPTGTAAGSRSCIGVDLQGEAAVAVRAERVRGRMRYTRFACRVPAELSAAAGDAPVAASLACRRSFTRWLEAPFASPRKARRVLPTLLDIQLPFALEACIFSFPFVEKTPEGRVRALAAAVRLPDAAAALEAYRQLGLDPVLLDQEGLALWSQAEREVPPETADPGGRRVVVYMGRDRSALVIGGGGRVLATHALKAVDAQRVGRLLAAQLPDASAPGAPPAVEWIWTGPQAEGAHAEALRTELSDRWGGSSRTVEDPGAFLARALAVRALTSGPLSVNFRTGGLEHAGLARRSRRRLVAASLLLLAAGVCLCGLNLALRVAAGRVDRHSRERLADLADAVAGYHLTARGEHALQRAAVEAENRVERLAAFRAAFAPSLGDLLAGILRTGKGVRFELLSLNSDRLQIHATGPAWDSGEALNDLLTGQGWSARLSRQPALPDGRVPFRVEAEKHDL